MLFRQTIRSRWLSIDARTSFIVPNPSVGLLLPTAYCLLPLFSNPFRIEAGLHPRPVPLQRPFGAGGVGTLEDPVLPGGEAAEDLGLDGLRAGEPQVGLHAGEAVGREGRPL